MLSLDSTGPGELRVEGPGRSVVGRADLLLSFLDEVVEGGRRALGVRSLWRQGLHVGMSAVSEHLSEILGEVDQRVVKHEIGGGALSVP